MSSQLGHLGPMRMLLLGTVLLSLPFAFFTDREPVGFGVMTAYVIPSLATIFIFVLLLDALVNRVFMSEKPEPEKIPHRTCIRADLVVLGLLLLCWMPFYYNLIETYVD